MDDFNSTSFQSSEHKNSENNNNTFNNNNNNNNNNLNNHNDDTPDNFENGPTLVLNSHNTASPAVSEFASTSPFSVSQPQSAHPTDAFANSTPIPNNIHNSETTLRPHEFAAPYSSKSANDISVPAKKPYSGSVTRKEVMQEIIYQGTLHKQSPSFHRQWQARWFTLTKNGVMQYYKAARYALSPPINSIDLGKCNIIMCEGSRFKIASPNHTYLLKAATEKEKDAWIKYLSGFAFSLQPYIPEAKKGK